MIVEMKTPITPNNMMVKKFWKNFFFLTWNLAWSVNQVSKSIIKRPENMGIISDKEAEITRH